MKIKQNATGVQTFKDTLSGARIGFVESDYAIDISPKELRKIGFNVAYGAAQGVIAAYAVGLSVICICKALKEYIDKHSKFEDFTTETEKEPVTEEPAEEK